jgi:cell division septum initiation protein DivIVA
VTTATISITVLRRLNACADQIDLFLATFGEEAEVSPENVRRADEAGLDVVWLATHRERAEFVRASAAAGAEYERVTAPARAEYERVTAPARAEYERVTAPAGAEYERVTAPARAEYRRVTAAAEAEYERVTAAAWVECLRVTAAAWVERATAPACVERDSGDWEALAARIVAMVESLGRPE